MTLLLVFWCPWMIFSSTHENHWNENPNEREIVLLGESKEKTVKRRTSEYGISLSLSFCFSLFVATSTFARWSFQCFWAFQSSFNLFLWSWVKFVHQRICKFTSLIHIESEYICDVYFYWCSIKYYGFQIFILFSATYRMCI